jgi:hypothetical protein
MDAAVALPLILRKMEDEDDEPDMWFVALQSLTNADPVTDEIREILRRWQIGGYNRRQSKAMSGSWSPQDFPLLTDGDWIGPPSPKTMRYNCIAWSVGKCDKKWWPDQWGIGAWFPGQPRIASIQGFIDGYRSIGYRECSDGILEPGIEKIALYAKAWPGRDSSPTYAAYQLDNGHWQSKLGDFEDIEHFGIEVLHGYQYGTVVFFMSRPRQPRPNPPTY